MGAYQECGRKRKNLRRAGALAIRDSYSQLTMLLLKSCDYLEVLDLKPVVCP
jgi:hypothetical protein